MELVRIPPFYQTVNNHQLFLKLQAKTDKTPEEALIWTVLNTPEWKTMFSDSIQPIIDRINKVNSLLKPWSHLINQPIVNVDITDKHKVAQTNIAFDNFWSPELSARNCKEYPKYLDIVDRYIGSILQKGNVVLKDRQVVKEYVGNDFFRLWNNDLYNNYKQITIQQQYLEFDYGLESTERTRYQPSIKRLTELIRESEPLTQDTIVWRGLSGVEFKWWRQGDHTMQQTIWPGFTSTSMNLSESIKVFSKDPDNSYIFRIHLKKGLRALPIGVLWNYMKYMKKKWSRPAYSDIQDIACVSYQKEQSDPDSDCYMLYQGVEAELLLEPNTEMYIDWNSFHTVYYHGKLLRVFDVFVGGYRPNPDFIPSLPGALKPWMKSNVLIYPPGSKKLHTIYAIKPDDSIIATADDFNSIIKITPDQYAQIKLPDVQKGDKCIVLSDYTQRITGFVLDSTSNHSHYIVKLVGGKVDVYRSNQVYAVI